MKFDEWRKLIEKSGLDDVEIDANYEVLENPAIGVSTILRYLKLVYCLIVNSWFRSLFFEIMELRKSVF